jgi:hypothetical protein
MENKKKLALKTASIFAAALSAIAGGNEILNSEDLTSSNSDLKSIEFKTSPSKVKPVGVFKLNPFNLGKDISEIKLKELFNILNQLGWYFYDKEKGISSIFNIVEAKDYVKKLTKVFRTKLLKEVA